MTNLQNLTVDQLRKVVAIKEQIEDLESQLSAIAGGSSEAPVRAVRRRRRRMSAAARARIGAAQRARWAKVKGRRKAAKAAKKAKRHVSAATRARLAAIAKARWAKVKASGKSTL
ncbi:MAG: hypothetical protein ABSH38_10410 [Verrucomicrobiota bacterium]|jgi:hypothetical protein